MLQLLSSKNPDTSCFETLFTTCRFYPKIHTWVIYTYFQMRWKIPSQCQYVAEGSSHDRRLSKIEGFSSLSLDVEVSEDRLSTVSKMCLLHKLAQTWTSSFSFTGSNLVRWITSHMH